LVEAKTNLKHGGWLKWLDANFEGSVSLANKYMQVAQNRNAVTNLNGSKGEVSLRGALNEVRQKAAEEKDRKRRAEIAARAREIQEAGGLGAVSQREVPGPWWWRSLTPDERAEIRRGADPDQVTIGSLKVRRVLGTFCKTEDWVSAKQLERALVKDLEAVRNQRSAPTPDLNDPRVVYEIGERVLSNSDKRGGAWQRLAAFAKGEAPGRAKGL